MIALTVLQPWAQLIADERKFIETRAWKTEYRGPIAIHAGKGLDHLDKSHWFDYEEREIERNTGGIVAVAVLRMMLPSQTARERYPDQIEYGDFSDGRWCWILSDIVKLPTILPARGKPGLWRLENWRVV